MSLCYRSHDIRQGPWEWPSPNPKPPPPLPTTTTTKTTRPLKKNISFVPHSARTATVNDDDHSNSDSTTTEANNSHNDNENTNGPANIAVVLRLARGDNNSKSGYSSRKRWRSPTAVSADPSSSSSSWSGDGRRGILGRPRTGEAPTLEAEEPYVSSPVLAIIANIDDATIPVERDSDLADEQGAAKARPYARRRRPSSMRQRLWNGSRSMSCSRPSGGASP